MSWNRFGTRARPIARHISPATVFYVVATASIAIACLLNARRLHIEQTRPLGHLTRQQALDRSETLCQTLSPTATPRLLAIEPFSGHTGKSWRVSSQDASGQEETA